MINFSKRFGCIAIAAVLTAHFPAAPVAASELVYTPINPHFGGNPFNAAGLLASAEAQNRFKDSAAPVFPDVIIDPDPPQPDPPAAQTSSARLGNALGFRLD